MMLPKEIKDDFYDLVKTYQQTLKTSYTLILAEAGLKGVEVVRKSDKQRGFLRIADGDGFLSYCIKFYPRNKDGSISKYRARQVLLNAKEPAKTLIEEFERY